MTSLIAAVGSGRSTNVIPAVPAAWSVTTIAFISGHLLGLAVSADIDKHTIATMCFGSYFTAFYRGKGKRKIAEAVVAVLWPAIATPRRTRRQPRHTQ